MCPWRSPAASITSASLPERVGPNTNFYYSRKSLISQTLLRDGDRRRIAQLLTAERQAGRIPLADEERIAVFLRRFASRLPKHLQKIILHEDTQDVGRLDDLIQEVLDLYLGLGSENTPDVIPHRLSDRLTAGLYRFEDYAARVLEYRMFPRQPLHYQGEPVLVVWNGERQQLQRYRHSRRWFRWLGPAPLQDPIPVAVVEHPRLRQLILPASTFWVFVRETPEVGPWATWRRPELDERFILLCQPDHSPHLETLKRAELLAWDSVQAMTVFDKPWQEYRGCRVVASNWDEVVADEGAAELFAYLRPPSRASIHLAGGLPAPDDVGWLQGALPTVWVAAFQDEVAIRLCPLLDPEGEREWFLPANDPDHPQTLPPELTPGPYVLSAHAGGKRLAERVLEIRDWGTLEAQDPEEAFDVSLPAYRLRGAVLDPYQG